MVEQNSTFTYQCGVYLRLSKEDEDISSTHKSQSNSIENQKQFITEYVSQKEDIEIAQYYVDDGYSGVNFDRPSFQKMIQDLKDGKINCVIVKDLSRFGRNYIEAGYYMERFFPVLGIRFIAINDYYDSTDVNAAVSHIILPFKNLINDAYCRDISIKIRSHLEIKRKNGAFVGAFTVYGYQKGENRNQLEIDVYAAQIVKEIFRMKLKGMSQQTIAEELNQLGILSPAEYKKEQGSNYKAVFQRRSKAIWTAMAVSRILKNEIYTGTMVQGKESTPNYKMKVRQKKRQEQWCRVEHTHKAIISPADFEVVQDIMKKEMRVTAGKKEVSIFSGYLLCPDCGCSMVRKQVSSSTQTYVYYICSKNKKDKNCCTSHRISEKALYRAVQESLYFYIHSLVDWKELVGLCHTSNSLSDNTAILEQQLEKEQKEIVKYHQLKGECYQDYKTGLLSQEEYLLFQQEMENRIACAKNTISELQKRKESLLCEQNNRLRWMEEFLACQGEAAELNRLIIVRLIDCIYVYEDHRIEVMFRSQDEIERMAPCQ